MKKLYCLVVFLFFSIYGICYVHASSWKFMWDEETTSIDIPLGGNLQNYLSIPKASLYRDGTLLTDAEIHYVTTGDWLYLLTDVDTQKIGDYQVWYKAIEDKYKPGQCQGYKTLITFHVVDVEPPKILECPKQIVYPIGTSRPEYEKQIIATDNSGNFQTIVDDSGVRYDTPGIYTVYVSVKDAVFITKEEIIVIVEDPIGPIVTFLGENNRIVLTKGEEVLLKKYFKAYDSIDGDVTNSITYEPFSTNMAKRFDLEVWFQDSNGNKTSMVVQIEIVDKDEVKIELYKTSLLLDYNKDIEQALLENIKSAYLGSQNIKNDIIIDTGALKKEVGGYVVTYIYDYGNKQGSVNCEVNLLTSVAPILLVENVNIKIGEKVRIKDYIMAKDPSDDDIEKKIEFDERGVDYTKAGIYPVLVTVTNSSNLSTTQTLYITIYDSSSSAIENATSPLYLLVGLGILLIGGGIGIFIYFKKKRNCNTNENKL